MAATSNFVNGAGQPYSGPPIPAQGENFATSAKGVQMDPRMLDIIQTAQQAYQSATGLPVQMFSGVQDRTSGTTNHPGGYAIDVRIYDANGKPLANSPADAERLGQNLSNTFRTYEAFAQTARDIQTRKYPELNDTFRWGGYFAAGDTPLDLMHLDMNPKMGGATGGGTWASGATPGLLKMMGSGASSVGMEQTILNQLGDLGFKGPNAVQDYQRAKGLPVDGIVGPQTAARVALDVTPQANIPNPYGLHDVTQALLKADPQAVNTSLQNLAGQIWSAHQGGTPDDQIAKQLNSYFGLLTPAEQAAIRANFDASPEAQAAVANLHTPGVGPLLQSTVDGAMRQAVYGAIQSSRDLASSLMTNTLVGGTTQAQVDQAMANMAKVNPGKTFAGATSGYESPTPDVPRIRPAIPGGQQAAPPQQVGDALGSNGTLWKPGDPMPQTFAQGLPNPANHLRPGEGGAAAPDMSAALQALRMLIPGLPGMGGAAAGINGAGAQPPMGQGTPATGAFAGLAPRLSPGGPPAMGAFAGLTPRISPASSGGGDPTDGSSGNGIWQPGDPMPQTFTAGLPDPRQHLRPADASSSPSIGQMVSPGFDQRGATNPASGSAVNAYNAAIAGTGSALWRNPSLAMDNPAVRALTGATPRITPASAAIAAAAPPTSPGDDMGSMGTLWSPGGAMPQTFAEGLPNPMDHLRPGDLSGGGGNTVTVASAQNSPRITAASSPAPAQDSGSSQQYDTSAHGMGSTEDWFLGF